MNVKHYEQFQQDVYHQQLSNGLDVTLIPRKGFEKAYAILTANYGSVDSKFTVNGNQTVTVPDGIAHFLEHKMFEKADHDAFDIFGKYGADSNAFTSYTQTSYQFSTTQNVQANLKTLLDFVQTPYFSLAGVQKEQGIIGQEIRMYNDNPDSQLYTKTVANLYPNDPMHIDIAGTQQSISEITPQLLMKCYRTFYQPSNLKLVVVGNINPSETLQTILNIEAHYDLGQVSFERGSLISDPLANDVVKHGKVQMPVQRPKAMLGIRGIAGFTSPVELLKYKLACELMLEMILDDTTANYLRLYNQGIIDDSFGFSFEMERGFHFATISSDTDHPDQFFKTVRQILVEGATNIGIMENEFVNVKRGALGRLVMSLNSPEAIANRYSSSLFSDINVFDEINVLKTMNIGDLYRAFQLFIDPQRMTEFCITP